MATTTRRATSQVIARALSSDGKRFYYINQDGHGNVWCSCPAWKFQKQVNPMDRTCKHIDRYNSGSIKKVA